MIKLFVAAVITGVFIVPATVLAESSNSSNQNARQDVSDTKQDKKDTKATKKTSKTKASDKSATNTTMAAATAAAGTASKPGDIIDLSNWYLTLPTGAQGKPDTVQTAALANYSSEFMKLNASRDGVVFTANAGGNHTKNSKYPRSELREMIGGKNASWDGTKGTHTMEIKQAVTKIPPKKPEVVVGQIHATTDDLMQIHLSGSKLTVKYDDGKKKVSLDDNYQLGAVFTVKIESAAGHVKVWYNGEQKADLPISSKTSYFKAGNYLQTNPSMGDAADATSEVVIYALSVKHQ